VSFLHRPTNLIACCGIDDLWVDPAGELLIVDYKSTAKDSEQNSDAKWHNGDRIGYYGMYEILDYQLTLDIRAATGDGPHFGHKAAPYTQKSASFRPTRRAFSAIVKDINGPPH
jgi:hypothetical protein